MEMLLTTAGFLAITALAVLWHLRRTGPPAAAASAPTGEPCPRCSTPIVRGATFCPGCGVPVQVWDVVRAPTRDPATAGADDGAAKHAVVRADACVGCGTCVDACPEDGAIRLEGKLAVVDQQKCVVHGACVSACPVGAIVITTGEAVQRVEAPEIGDGFESNVPGVYIVGELGGRGLIKNAINEGKIAVEHIAGRIAQSPRPDEPDVHDIVIVGSGPAGLSAALEARRQKLSAVVLEQGSLAESIRKYPRRKLLLAEPVRIPLYGDLWVADASKETLLEVWETIVANSGITLETHCRVENVARHGDLFEVRAGERAFRGRFVVLAMGRRGTPRKLGVPGEELDKVFYDVVEMDMFRGRRVLVVGGGDSAVESALGAANQEGATVTLSYRGERITRARPRNIEKLERAVAEGRIELLCPSQVVRILPDSVELRVGGATRTIPNDDVVIRIGGEAPYAFLERIGVRIVTKDVPLATELEGVGA